MRNIVVCICLAVLLGCSPGKEGVEIDDSFGLFVDVRCGDARFSQEQYDTVFSELPDELRAPILTELEKKQHFCETLKSVQAALVKTASESSEGAVLPADQYRFEFSAGVNEMIQVGFFDSEQDCQVSRGAIISLGLNAEACTD